MAQRQQTTGRFGVHGVPDLVLAHRDRDAVVVPVVVWVSAPVPLALDELVSVLYANLQVGEACTPGEARRTVTDFTVNGGTQYVDEIFCAVAQERLDAHLDVEHWRFCERLALAALAPDNAPRVPAQAGCPVGLSVSGATHTVLAGGVR